MANNPLKMIMAGSGPVVADTESTTIRDRDASLKVTTLHILITERSNIR